MLRPVDTHAPHVLFERDTFAFAEQLREVRRREAGQTGHRVPIELLRIVPIDVGPRPLQAPVVPCFGGPLHRFGEIEDHTPIHRGEIRERPCLARRPVEALAGVGEALLVERTAVDELLGQALEPGFQMRAGRLETMAATQGDRLQVPIEPGR
jgi:hypothetical protein